MFERFTDRARRVVVLAQDEARQHHHDHIGSEHLLLGLIRVNEGVASRMLLAAGISLDAASAEVDRIVGVSDRAPTGHIPFDPGAKKVLEQSLREAFGHGHVHIGTEHLLLGLLRLSSGVGVEVLVNLGVRPEDLERAVRSEWSAELAAQSPSVAATSALSEVRALSGDVHAQLTALSDRLDALSGRFDDLAGRVDNLTTHLAVLTHRLDTLHPQD